VKCPRCRQRPTVSLAVQLCEACAYEAEMGVQAARRQRPEYAEAKRAATTREKEARRGR
jgi:hypothetical protein